MPKAAAIKSLPTESQDALAPWANTEQLMTTGEQAQAYANHYIWQHLQSACAEVKDANGNALPAVPADKCTYSGIGSVAKAATSPAAKDAYEALRSSNFQGDALLSMLLTAYAFWLIGSIALYAGISLIVIGVALLVLGFFVLPKKSATPYATA